MDMHPRLSTKEYLILDLLLGEGDQYGLQLVEASDGELKRGTAYTMLNRMADKGYIESRQEDRPLGQGGLPLRIFGITDRGAKIFEALYIARQSLQRG